MTRTIINSTYSLQFYSEFNKKQQSVNWNKGKDNIYTRNFYYSFLEIFLDEPDYPQISKYVYSPQNSKVE